MQYKELKSFPISTFNGQIEAQLSPDENFVAYVDYKKLFFYNLSNQEIKTKYFNIRILSLEFSNDSLNLYVGFNDSIICYQTRNLFIKVCSFQHTCNSYVIQRSNLLLYNFNTIKIINLRTRKLVIKLECKQEIKCIAVSDNLIAVGLIAVGLIFGQIRIYLLYQGTIQARVTCLQFFIDQIQIIENQVIHIDGGGNLICWKIDFNQKILTSEWIISSNDQCVNFCYSFTDKFYCLMFKNQLKFYDFLKNLINIQILSDKELIADQCRVRQGQKLEYILVIESSFLSIYSRNIQLNQTL